MAEYFKATYSRACPIHFAGLWDTVSSVGWVHNPVVLPFSARNPDIRIGRHAVSIHERRCYYRQNLWGPPLENQDIKQVWFAGVHSDIGGSYLEEESGLSKLTLEWMLHEADIAGLKINDEKAAVVLGKSSKDESWQPDYVRPDPHAEIHPSLHGLWWILEYLPHRYVDLRTGTPVVRLRFPLGARRYIPKSSVIYELARQRLENWDSSFKVETPVIFPPPDPRRRSARA